MKKISLFIVLSISLFLLSWCNSSQEKDFSESGNEKYYAGDYVGAIQDYDKEIALDSGWADVYMDRALAKAAFWDYQSAISDYDKSIELEPKLVGAYIERGWVKAELKNYDLAISDFNKAIELAPNLGESYYYRGFVNIYLEKINEGCIDLQKALDLNYSEATLAIKEYCQVES